ncbi:hypothetical protein EWB00_000433 [Schistosoma japonicum]|uniref:Uncharacterized protein n=1 Tax=Schistosoma japonicum TaxID=6182 RepID=A0A4Z2DIZ1_SCHJA|nr:hypothetical protein EWB00_000433 [Schistosoma japonicum]
MIMNTKSSMKLITVHYNYKDSLQLDFSTDAASYVTVRKDYVTSHIVVSNSFNQNGLSSTSQ